MEPQPAPMERCALAVTAVTAVTAEPVTRVVKKGQSMMVLVVSTPMKKTLFNERSISNIGENKTCLKPPYGAENQCFVISSRGTMLTNILWAKCMVEIMANIG